MYDELVKRLREDAPTALANCDFDFMEGWIKEAADAIEQLSNAGNAYGRGWTLGYNAGREESKPKWIPVTERLPDLFMHVLVNIPGLAPHPTVQEAFREMNGLWYTNGFRYEENDITHWMPLPEPPEKEET